MTKVENNTWARIRPREGWSVETELTTWQEYYDAAVDAIGDCDFETARRHLETAQEMLDDMGEGDLADLMQVVGKLAHVYHFGDDLTAADEAFGQYVVMAETMYGETSLGVAEILGDWAQVHVESGNFRKAERLLVRQAGITESELQSIQLQHAAALGSLAFAERKLGKLSRSLLHTRECVEIYQYVEGWDSLSLVQPIENYLLVLKAMAAQRLPAPARKPKPKRTNGDGQSAE